MERKSKYFTGIPYSFIDNFIFYLRLNFDISPFFMSFLDFIFSFVPFQHNFVGCDAMLADRSSPIFRGNILLLSSGLEGKPEASTALFFYLFLAWFS
jgi:hypothetical protein